MQAQLNYKPHLVLALLLGLWLTLFLIFVGPYDTAELSLQLRATVMYGYGFIISCSYGMAIPFQKLFWKLSGKYVPVYELIACTIILLIAWPFSFWYYESPRLNGDYGFSRFSLEVYLPTLIIFTPLMVYGRWFINKKYKAPKPKAQVTSEKAKTKTLIVEIEKALEERFYLNPNITLSDLAKRLNINSKTVSQAINLHYQMNFNDFVNDQRIEKFLLAIENKEHQKHTLQGLAENCGFKSKATFNRAFRKKLNTSPSEYIKRQPK